MRPVFASIRYYFLCGIRFALLTVFLYFEYRKMFDHDRGFSAIYMEERIV